jgi:hypothetical protein
VKTSVCLSLIIAATSNHLGNLLVKKIQSLAYVCEHCKYLSCYPSLFPSPLLFFLIYSGLPKLVVKSSFLGVHCCKYQSLECCYTQHTVSVSVLGLCNYI